MNRLLLFKTGRTPILLNQFQKMKILSAIQHQLTEKFVVMYSGNLGITHDIESIVLTAEILKENTAIQFVIIGDGAKREKHQIL